MAVALHFTWDMERTNVWRWMRSLGFGAAIMAAILAVAIPANVALGREIHWDIVTILGLFGLVGLTVIHHQG